MQLESSPHLPELEKSPCNNEDPAQLPPIKIVPKKEFPGSPVVRSLHFKKNFFIYF